MLNKIQYILNSFTWQWKKPRIKALLLQQKKGQGGLSLPNITLYYRASLLESLLQWWNPLNKCSWGLEQIHLPSPLSEWALSIKLSSSLEHCLFDCNNTVSLGNIFIIICLQARPPGVLIWHPKFQEAVKYTSFQVWVDCDLTQFASMVQDFRIYSKEWIIQAINTSPIIVLQYCSMGKFMPWWTIW